jgi:hypothetical protein
MTIAPAAPAGVGEAAGVGALSFVPFVGEQVTTVGSQL